MIVLIFILGALLGILMGGALCVHYLRSEIAADIGPTLERMQDQLNQIDSAVNIALAKWYLALRHYPPRALELPPDEADDDDETLVRIGYGARRSIPKDGA